MTGHALLRGCGRRRSSRRADERGAVAVEFALVLPILMVIVFGIISFGYMLSFRQALSQAAAEGARAAAVAPSTVSDSERQSRAIAAVNDALSTHGVTCSGGNLVHDGTDAGTCTVSTPQSCSSGGGAGVTCVKITLDYEYQDHSLLPGFGVDLLLPEHMEYVSEVRVS